MAMLRFWKARAAPGKGKAARAAAPLVHVVLFQFKPELTPEQRNECCDQMLRLKDKCLHPTSSRPYIRSSVGGLDSSIEERQNGITHAFVVEFDSAEDRDYYVRRDPAHKAFVESMLSKLDKAQIIDFSPGVF
ncbi:stress responsive a/B barrel domain-containing protein [Purpureocillium lavendulum]|uniref:Stress responsive a/B barrel domain-containing protein n=1 Tax=Purpureocillium lavendulum TaxID=1247861 RepID=A0AB34FQM1_9HYPO|nr:stress responsive a/B barrel domain-containing protein [Purpureocillium lavendulum]